jgi:NAD(P)-dependent dehydrogenase (short-subunit alcohol dehydrogenase family)
MELSLEGKVVLVTGGSKGIGFAWASAFAADLGDAAAAGAMIDAVESGVGPVDVLVNSAGAARRTSPDKLTPSAWRAAFDAKFFSYVNVIDPVVKLVAARGGGVIVTVIGDGGKVACRRISPAARGQNAALMLATSGLGPAYAGKGVRVVGVSPGTTETGRVAERLTADAWLAKISVKEARQRSVARIPIGRMASPREIADAVLFLTSPRAGYITGVTLSVDGGQNPSVVHSARFAADRAPAMRRMGLSLLAALGLPRVA